MRILLRPFGSFPHFPWPPTDEAIHAPSTSLALKADPSLTALAQPRLLYISTWDYSLWGMIFLDSLYELILRSLGVLGNNILLLFLDRLARVHLYLELVDLHFDRQQSILCNPWNCWFAHLWLPKICPILLQNALNSLYQLALIQKDFFASPWTLQMTASFLKNPNYSLLVVGFLFAKLLRNFCGLEHKILLSLRKMFAQNNSTLRNFAQKSFRTKFVIPHLRNPVLRDCFCAILLFLNVHII